jgi:hypothetical protein
MNLSNYLAEIWGISMVVISLALLIKDKHLKSLFAKIDTEESLFAWGLISFIMGISIVLVHNIWTWNWQIIITILGWLALLKGLAHMFLPELFKKWTKKIENKQWLPIVLVVLVFIGLIITYLGFTM